MNIKNEFKKMSKSLIDSTNILVNIINIDTMSESLKKTQSSFSNKLNEFSKNIEEKIKKEESENLDKNDSKDDSDNVFSFKTENLELSVTIKKALIDAGLDTVEKIKAKTDKELLELKGIGAKALENLKKIIDK